MLSKWLYFQCVNLDHQDGHEIRACSWCCCYHEALRNHNLELLKQTPCCWGTSGISRQAVKANMETLFLKTFYVFFFFLCEYLKKSTTDFLCSQKAKRNFSLFMNCSHSRNSGYDLHNTFLRFYEQLMGIMADWVCEQSMNNATASF